ncbi:ATP-dependent DNA ligase [Cupriavidus sp. RAF12]|uniref:ATP-dependent DNA ligase n=1 Tax=Cupriavidus sp. RAF12 TaxID=3233050 RepID=UPI003F8FDCFA
MQAFLNMMAAAGASTKKDAKLAALKMIENCAESKNLVHSALSPFVRFGVKKIDMPPEFAPIDASVGQFIGLMNELSSRQLTGNAARARVTHVLGQYTEITADLLARVLKKDLDVGIKVDTANKAYPGWIPDVPYMRCSLPKAAKFDTWDWVGGAFSQEKADGMFVNVDHTDDGEVRISSRQGQEFPLEQYAPIVDLVRTLLPRGVQCHGELVVHENGLPLERQISNGHLNHINQGGEFDIGLVPVLFLWDMVSLAAVKPKGSWLEPYHDRVASLARLLRFHDAVVRLIPTKVVHSLDEAYEHAAELMAQGKEGTILKERNAVWEDRTSKSQIKLKLEADVDLEVVGFNPGEGKNAATFGSMRVQTRDRLLEVNISGFSDKQRQEIHEARDLWIGQIVTVRGNLVLKPSASNPLHSIFLPRFVERRTDKYQADMTQEVIDQFEAAKLGK